MFFNLFENKEIDGNDGDAKTDLLFTVSHTRLDRSHHVERQKLMVNSREEMSACLERWFCG